MDKVVRLMKIIIAVQANPGITAQALAEKCEVTKRTIFRDIDLLTPITPIISEQKGYRFIGNFHLYPLNFSEQEAMAFSLLPSMLDKSKLPPGFDTAYDKVMSTHIKEKSMHQSMLQNITDIIQMGTPAHRQENPNFLQPIIQAAFENRSLQTIYHTQSRDETTTRKIDPYYLVPREQRFYLIAYCHSSQAIRTFRLSRFQHIELADSTFRRGDFNIKQYMKYTWSIDRGKKNTKFKVRFSPAVARYIKEEELFVQPWMKDLKDGGLLFEVTVNNEKEFIMWVLRYGPDAEILEPLSIREKLKQQLQQWIQMY